MKEMFWSRGSGKDRTTSRSRQLLEGAQVFLAVRSLEADADDMGVWLHVGFMNFKTWAMSTLQLACSRMAEDGQRAYLELVELQASEMPCFLEQVCEEEDGSTLQEMSALVRTLQEAAKTTLPLDKPCSVSFWRLAADVTAGTPIMEQMLPCFLQVVPLEDAPTTSVWQGADAEDRQAHAAKKSGQRGVLHRTSQGFLDFIVGGSLEWSLLGLLATSRLQDKARERSLLLQADIMSWHLFQLFQFCL